MGEAAPKTKQPEAQEAAKKLDPKQQKLLGKLGVQNQARQFDQSMTGPIKVPSQRELEAMDPEQREAKLAELEKLSAQAMQPAEGSEAAIFGPSLQVEVENETYHDDRESLEPDAAAGQIVDLRKRIADKQALVDAEAKVLEETRDDANALEKANEAAQDAEVTELRQKTVDDLGETKAKETWKEAEREALDRSEVDAGNYESREAIVEKTYDGHTLSEAELKGFGHTNELTPEDQARAEVAEAIGETGASEEVIDQAAEKVEEHLEEMGIDPSGVEEDLTTGRQGELTTAEHIEAAMQKVVGDHLVRAVVDDPTLKLAEKIQELTPAQVQPVKEAAALQEENGEISDLEKRRVARAIAEQTKAELKAVA